MQDGLKPQAGWPPVDGRCDMILLGIAQSRDAAQAPVIRVDIGLHEDERDVGEVSALRLFVDGALVEARITWTGLNGEHVDDGQHHE